MRYTVNMFERFTNEASATLDVAESLAVAAGSTEIQEQHILIAALDSVSGRAAIFGSVQKLFTQTSSSDTTDQTSNAEPLAYSTSALAILDQSTRTALLAGRNEVWAVDILLAASLDQTLGDRLRGGGVDPQDFAASVRRIAGIRKSNQAVAPIALGELADQLRSIRAQLDEILEQLG